MEISSIVVLSLDDFVKELALLLPLLALPFLLLEEIFPVLLCVSPWLWIYDGIYHFLDCFLPSLLAYSPWYRCFWIWDKLCNNNAFNSIFFSCALMIFSFLSLYLLILAFIILMVYTKSRGVSTTLLSSYSSSLKCEVFSIL